MTFAELVARYFHKAGIYENEGQLKFLFNGSLIHIYSCKSLEELRIRDCAKIEVIVKSISQNIINFLFFII